MATRRVAVGVLDMALWDAARQSEGASRCGACSPIGYNNRKADKTAWVYAAGGYYYPEKDISALVDEK